jgi:hypothetical protein
LLGRQGYDQEHTQPGRGQKDQRLAKLHVGGACSEL